MVQSPIRYDDGAAYERMMGAWSRIAGLCRRWEMGKH
jgi:hypothetical protein